MDPLDELLNSAPQLAAPMSLLARSLLDLAGHVRGPAENPYAKYQKDPVGYARDVLKVTLTPVQEEILRALLEPPFRVMVKSGHSVGKTFLSAVAVNWWYDCFVPSMALTTAPSEKDVKDLLWKEVRMQRMRAGLSDTFIGPAAPEMRTAPDHVAKGYTARKEFQGRHDARMLFVFDEAMGVERIFWETTKTMFQPDGTHAWLVIFNPTDTTSIAYQEEHAIDADGKPIWRVFSMSALDHPNVVERREVIPGAVSYAQVSSWVVDWCEPIHPDDVEVTDIFWEGRYWRPGPEMEGRGLGRWPTKGTGSVWSDALWEAAAKPIDPRMPIRMEADVLPEIGGDVAGPGKDMTEYHARWGVYSLSHESYNGWMMTRKIGRLKELAGELADMVNRARHALNPGAKICDPRQILIKLDDANVGGEMVALMREAGYNCVGINVQQTWGVDLSKYPDMRSQLWFSTAKQASMGLVRSGRLPRKELEILKAQAMAPEWHLDMAGRRCVERKEITMDKCGRSPDGLDAKNLAFLNLGWKPPQWVSTEKPVTDNPAPLYREEHRQLLRDRIRSRGHRSLFGRR